MDSNHRRRSRRIYSPFHLATLELSHFYRTLKIRFFISYQQIDHPIKILIGAWGRNRTTDTEIFSLLLYRLSYPGAQSSKKPSCVDLFIGYNIKWSWWSESNQQPADYKSAALPLSHTSILVPRGGIEPPTRGFSVPCSTD